MLEPFHQEQGVVDADTQHQQQRQQVKQVELFADPAEAGDGEQRRQRGRQHNSGAAKPTIAPDQQQQDGAVAEGDQPDGALPVAAEQFGEVRHLVDVMQPAVLGGKGDQRGAVANTLQGHQ
jgi:hypothetical protein